MSIYLGETPLANTGYDKAYKDLSNVTPTQSFKKTSVNWGMPDYSAGYNITFPFTAPCDGILKLKGANRTENTVAIDGVTTFSQNIAGSYGQSSFIPFPISKGQTATVTSGGMSGTCSFYPLKGAN